MQTVGGVAGRDPGHNNGPKQIPQDKAQYKPVKRLDKIPKIRQVTVPLPQGDLLLPDDDQAIKAQRSHRKGEQQNPDTDPKEGKLVAVDAHNIVN